MFSKVTEWWVASDKGLIQQFAVGYFQQLSSCLLHDVETQTDENACMTYMQR